MQKNRKKNTNEIAISKDFESIILIKEKKNGKLIGFDVFKEKCVALNESESIIINRESPILTKIMDEQFRFALLMFLCNSDLDRGYLMGVSPRTIARYKKGFNNEEDEK